MKSIKIIIPIAIVIIIGVLLVVYFSMKGETINNSIRNSEVSTELTIRLFDMLESQGAITTDEITDNIIYFDQDLWYKQDYMTKASTTQRVAIYCNYKNNDYSVEIKDLYSGETLATYSDFWGTQVER